jgi:hypothetical protein
MAKWAVEMEKILLAPAIGLDLGGSVQMTCDTFEAARDALLGLIEHAMDDAPSENIGQLDNAMAEVKESEKRREFSFDVGSIRFRLGQTAND